jgi:hypothetical protein
MTTSLEMDQQFGDSEIERRLKDLERKIEAYEQGGFDIFRQFGYLQLGLNIPRLDQNGIQILSKGASRSAIFFFDDHFEVDPNSPTAGEPVAALIGFIDGDAAAPIAQLSKYANSGTATAEHTAIAENDTNDAAIIQSYVNVGSDLATVRHEMDGGRTFAQLLLSNTVLRLASFTSDPGTLGDGDIWYRSDTDTIHARVNGVTVALGGGGGSMPMPPLVSSLGWHGLGKEMRDFGTVASATWPNTNQAFYIPITVTEDITVVKLWCFNGATASGNVNMSLYDSSFAQVANTEIGSTAQAGTNVVQEFNITDTALTAGLYYLAIVMDNTTGTIFRRQAPVGTFEYLTVIGMATEGAAFNLPATATPVAVGFDFAPLCGLSTRTLVT